MTAQHTPPTPPKKSAAILKQNMFNAVHALEGVGVDRLKAEHFISFVPTNPSDMAPYAKVFTACEAADRNYERVFEFLIGQAPNLIFKPKFEPVPSLRNPSLPPASEKVTQLHLVTPQPKAAPEPAAGELNLTPPPDRASPIGHSKDQPSGAGRNMNTIQFDPRFAPHVEALVRFFSSRETKTLRARTVCQFVVGKGEGRRWSQSAVNQARVDAWCKENLPIAGWYYYGSHRYVRHTR